MIKYDLGLLALPDRLSARLAAYGFWRPSSSLDPTGPIWTSHGPSLCPLLALSLYLENRLPKHVRL